jgi:hypothetical protein
MHSWQSYEYNIVLSMEGKPSQQNAYDRSLVQLQCFVVVAILLLYVLIQGTLI